MQKSKFYLVLESHTYHTHTTHTHVIHTERQWEERKTRLMIPFFCMTYKKCQQELSLQNATHIGKETGVIKGDMAKEEGREPRLRIISFIFLKIQLRVTLKEAVEASLK